MNGKSIKYIRPLDRSQDKQFEKLVQTNQMSVTALRAAVEKTKSRMAFLKDANGLKDEMIEEERILRKAAEDRLDNFLVDLYNNPDVNSELRQRLPYANKDDPFVKGKDMAELPDSSDYGEKIIEPSKDPSLHETQCQRFGLVTNNSTQGLISFSEGNLHSVSHTGVKSDHGESQTDQALWSSLPAYSQSLSPDAQTGSSWMGSGSGMLPSLVASDNSILTVSMAISHVLPAGPLSSSANSVASFAALPLPKPHQQPSTLSANPLESASFASLAAASYIDLPANHDYKAPDDFTTHSSASVLSQPESRSVSMIESRAPLYRDRVTSVTTDPEPSLSATNARTFYPSLLPSQPSSLLWTHRMPHDNVSHISRLLAEIATLKKENQELKDKLKTCEQKCEELRLNIGKAEEDKEEDDIGALIEEIRAAEKVRDQIAKEIVQAAKEDKEKALKELSNKRSQRNKDLDKTKTASEDDYISETDDDDTVKTSDSSFTSDKGEEPGEPSSDVSDELRHQHSRHELNQMIQRQRQIMAEELQKVIDQRNEARQAIIKLERKLSASELKTKSDGKVQELVATLSVVRRERDVAVARLKALMADVADTKLVYSLHKALWKEDPRNEMSSDGPPPKFTNTDPSVMKSNTVSSYLSKHEETKAKLEARLAFSDQERQLQSQRINELEQLVKRQRQKLNTLCAGPMLMDGAVETE